MSPSLSELELSHITWTPLCVFVSTKRDSSKWIWKYGGGGERARMFLWLVGDCWNSWNTNQSPGFILFLLSLRCYEDEIWWFWYNCCFCLNKKDLTVSVGSFCIMLSDTSNNTLSLSVVKSRQGTLVVELWRRTIAHEDYVTLPVLLLKAAESLAQ